MSTRTQTRTKTKKAPSTPLRLVQPKADLQRIARIENLRAQIEKTEWELASLLRILTTFYNSLRLPTLATSIQTTLDAFIIHHNPIADPECDRAEALITHGCHIIDETGISESDLAEIIVRYRPRMEEEVLSPEKCRMDAEVVLADLGKAEELCVLKPVMADFLRRIVEEARRKDMLDGCFESWLEL
ncbi:hypothetical protein BJ508DRAFT_381313 [Ascobolus immersus RN42]|uniref:Uncharacterized protein n=1 Tax=Ascobolus immersus RN42 TaxID=1160509 RepID=A0A3N4HH82_ASCIM|nr:hypothetical protein BJ508DRAFT_381313 [Ascobolus immersus RN42]